MNIPSIDIKNMLVSESDLGLVFATNLFIGRSPSSPNDIVTIYDVPAREEEISLNPKNEIYEFKAIQIKVRAIHYQTGFTLIEAIKTYLHGRANVTQESSFYTLITCTNGPALLEWDDSNRVNFIINFELQRKGN